MDSVGVSGRMVESLLTSSGPSMSGIMTSVIREMNRAGVQAHDIECFTSRFSGEDRVAILPQGHLQKIPDRCFVLDDEQCFRA